MEPLVYTYVEVGTECDDYFYVSLLLTAMAAWTARWVPWRPASSTESLPSIEHTPASSARSDALRCKLFRESLHSS